MLKKPHVVAVSAVVVIAALASVVLSRNSPHKFVFTMSGAEEVPPNSSTGSGNADVKIAGNQIKVEFSFEGLTGPLTGAHIHLPAAPGSNAPVVFNIAPGVFPAGTPSPIKATFTITDEQEEIVRDGRSYLNLHTAQFPGGEIRGQVVSSPDAN